MPGAPLALVGLGSWGRNHYRVLVKLGVLRWAFDADPDVCRGRAAEHHRARTLDALLDDPGVRGVVIATPARTHFELAKQALERGKDVLVEKPLTLDEREGAELAALAGREGRVLMVGHITLYHPAIQKLLALVAEGELGRLRYAYANRLNLGVVRESEDILWSFAPHDIAVFLQLFRRWPARVAAHGGSYLRPGRADVTVTHFELPEGARAHIFVSWLHPMKEHRLVVIGDRRMALFRETRGEPELEIYDAGAMPGEDPSLVTARGPGRRVAFSGDEPLELELRHFLEAMRCRQEPLTGARHGLEVLRILETARKSLQAGGLPMDCAPLVELLR